MNDLDYLRLNKAQKIVHNLKKSLLSMPKRLQNALKAFLMMFVNIFKGLGRALYDLVDTYRKGDWKTRVSYTVMGFGSIARGQWLRGILFFLFQTVFNLYLYFFGFAYLSKLTTLGTIESYKKGRVTVYGDNSFLILLYGVLTLFFIAAFLYTWRINIKQNKLSEQLLKSGKKLKTAKDDVNSMLDGQFHKTLLALPTAGVAIFTILPIIFMVLVAFTNYDMNHQPPANMFKWVGTKNFQTLLANAETPATVDITSSNTEKAILTITAVNGNMFTAETKDLNAAAAAQAATHHSEVTVKINDKAVDLSGKTMKAERHTITAVVAQKSNVEVITESVWYSNPDLTLNKLFENNLNAAVYQSHKEQPLVVLADANGNMAVLGGKEWINEELDAEKLTQVTTASLKAKRDGITPETSLFVNITLAENLVDRVSASKAKLILSDDIHANFALTEVYEEEKLVGYTMDVFSDKSDGVIVPLYNLISVKTPSFSYTFKQVLLWTLIWAFFATFLNYFLGMLVAIMINKKGIKLKKLWRTILVMTIAIPQFVSLLYVSKMFAADGLINSVLMNLGWIDKPLPFWTDTNWARTTIIGINVWIGIPYLMLIATGILMNIPADLYESARIDGANAFQTYRKITLPYMLFVTGPYLLTSFTGNINNFNVIFLLSQGNPKSLDLAGNAGSTDLLITWLYKMTVNDSNYKLAAVMGILVFVVCAVINLVVYNLIPSVKNEEDFQ